MTDDVTGIQRGWRGIAGGELLRVTLDSQAPERGTAERGDQSIGDCRGPE